jgi:centromere protein S
MEDTTELRKAIQHAVIQACMDEDAAGQTKMSPAALSTLSELTLLYVTTSLAPDLDAFADHAGRKTINESDVKLVARKNPSNLQQKLAQFCDEHLEQQPKSEPKKRTSMVNLQKKKPKKKPHHSDSSSSSDDDLLARKPAAVPKSRPALAPSDDDDDSDVQVVQVTGSRIAPRALGSRNPTDLDNILGSSSDDELLQPTHFKPTTKKVANRFKLNFQKNTTQQAMNSSDDEEKNVPPPVNTSKVQEFMDNMSLDSAPSEDEQLE